MVVASRGLRLGTGTCAGRDADGGAGHVLREGQLLFRSGNGAMLKWKEYLKQVTADAEELEPEERQQWLDRI